MTILKLFRILNTGQSFIYTMSELNLLGKKPSKYCKKDIIYNNMYAKKNIVLTRTFTVVS